MLPSELSGGMRRRVAIARAIITQPEILLYDSPTGGLDPVTSTTIVELIIKQRDVYKTSSLLVTHRLQDAFIMATHVFDRQTNHMRPLPKGSAIPAGTLLAPAPGAKVSKPPLLRWKSIKGARYYNVQLFRGKHKLLSSWPTKAHLQLRSSWTYRGRRHRLAAGRYRWYVWPGYGPRNRRHYGKLLGRRTFTMP